MTSWEEITATAERMEKIIEASLDVDVKFFKLGKELQTLKNQAINLPL